MSIEKLLQATVKAGGQELRLVPGRRMVIVTSAGEREVQGAEQTGAGIDQLLTAVMPAEARQALAEGQAEWRLQLASVGVVQARVDIRESGPVAAFRLGENGRPDPAPGAPVRAAAAAPPAPAPASPPSVAAPSASVATVGAAVGDRAAMERLLRTLVEMKASDLHMSVGSPPMVRHDGEIQALPGGGAVLTAEDTRRILWPIAPQRNRDEFERRNDTDFAYEIPGVARFRVQRLRGPQRARAPSSAQSRSKIITVEELGLPKADPDLCYLTRASCSSPAPRAPASRRRSRDDRLHQPDTRTDHIITIEDPIEFVHENKKCLVNQREVGVHTDSLQARAARRPARGPRHRARRRDARPRDRSRSPSRPRRRATSCSARCTRPRRRSTVDRIIDQFPADRQAQIRVMLARVAEGRHRQTAVQEDRRRPRAPRSRSCSRRPRSRT